MFNHEHDCITQQQHLCHKQCGVKSIVRKPLPTRLAPTEPERHLPPARLTPIDSQPVRRSVQPSKDETSNKSAAIVTEKIELYELQVVPERRQSI
ncbi:unnamed protein product [Arctia plantaginis]|uniref:Uncharacterized protein n=1 Tax=Arctia plantaginis TaxID=874455 RepID=A0A8S1BEE3_ARCPL|nr:unnamed protein product [Arctia plantaginis]